MNLSWSKSSLAALTKELTGRWQDTRESWRDARSLEFENKYMEELQASVNAALSAIERLDRIMTKIRNDCE